MKYEKVELIGNHHRIFVDPEYATSDDYRQFWADLANGNSKQGQYLHYDKIGKPVHLFGAYSIIQNENGKPSTVQKFVVDISEQIGEIKSLKKANELLTSKLDI